VNFASLKDWLGAEIAANGPVSVERYMRECLLHPQFGYYRTRQAIGKAGDFITAPEISQIFGELIGIWTAAAWTGLGEPERWRLVELGPGRGTLMMDLLRALKVLPVALAGVEVVLVEANPVLRDMQRALLAGTGLPVVWLEEAAGLAGLPSLPTVLIANEFLDALPIRQFVRLDGAWCERCITVSSSPRLSGERVPEGRVRGRLEFDAAPHPNPLPTDVWGERASANAPDGTISEIMSGAAALVAELAILSCAYMLFIDYGHEGPLFGDTLQAVTGHRFEDVLANPGKADLSAHVDFAQVRACATAKGLAGYGPIIQAEFLGRLGAAERLERLAHGKDAAAVQALQMGLARLMQPNGMGGRFKVLALASKGLARPPVF